MSHEAPLTAGFAAEIASTIQVRGEREGEGVGRERERGERGREREVMSVQNIYIPTRIPTAHLFGGWISHFYYYNRIILGILD